MRVSPAETLNPTGLMIHVKTRRQSKRPVQRKTISNQPTAPAAHRNGTRNLPQSFQPNRLTPTHPKRLRVHVGGGRAGRKRSTAPCDVVVSFWFAVGLLLVSCGPVSVFEFPADLLLACFWRVQKTQFAVWQRLFQ